MRKVRKRGGRKVTALDYNTKDGIKAYLASGLDGLNQLIRDRIEAGYKRNEKLDDFVIMGTWHTDSCGNFMRIDKPDLRKTGRTIPDVLTWKEVWDFVDRAGGITSSLRNDTPPAHVECPVCKKKWTLSNCFDVVTGEDDFKTDLKDFVGQPFAAVMAAFSLKTDGIYRSHPEFFVRNDKHIDLRPQEKYPSLKRNERGWVGSAFDEFADVDMKTYIVQPGDETSFKVYKYFHRECKQAHLKQVYVKHYTEILEEAGISGTLKAVPNGYCPCDQCGPWVDVETPFGRIHMGWRKRVINIDYPSEIKVDFSGENVTQGAGNIHAWSKAKAVEYLGKVRAAALPTLDAVAAGAEGIVFEE